MRTIGTNTAVPWANKASCHIVSLLRRNMGNMVECLLWQILFLNVPHADSLLRVCSVLITRRRFVEMVWSSVVVTKIPTQTMDVIKVDLIKKYIKMFRCSLGFKQWQARWKLPAVFQSSNMDFSEILSIQNGSVTLTSPLMTRVLKMYCMS